MAFLPQLHQICFPAGWVNEHRQVCVPVRQQSDERDDSGQRDEHRYKALAWANAEGLVSGVGANGTSYLQPLGNATRAQVAAILMRYVKNISKT